MNAAEEQGQGRQEEMEHLPLTHDLEGKDHLGNAGTTNNHHGPGEQKQHFQQAQNSGAQQYSWGKELHKNTFDPLAVEDQMQDEQTKKNEAAIS